MYSTLATDLEKKIETMMNKIKGTLLGNASHTRQ